MNFPPFPGSARRASVFRAFAASLLGLAAFVIPAATALAAPYPREGRSVEWTQPDGTTVRLRVIGDEFYARSTTEDGYTVLFDEATRAYVYAKQGEDGESLVSSGVLAGQPVPQNLAKQLHESARLATAKREAMTQLFAGDRETQWANRLRALRVRRAAAQGLAPSTEDAAALAGQGLSSKEIAAAAAPVSGGHVGLTILVQFPDDPQIPGNDSVSFPTTQGKITRYCNETGYTDDGNTGSVRDYFNDQSNGLLTFTQSVTAIITLPQPRNYYNYSDYPANTTLRQSGPTGRLLVADAIAALQSANFNFSNLSVDANNRVLSTSLLFAGNDSGVWSFGLWPHAWSLSGSGINVGTSGNPRYIFRYQATNTPNASPSIGTFCHELGHLLLGYPDLYDTNTENGDSEGVGEHCLMGSGNHLNGGRTPQPISLYLKDVSGWASLTDLTPAQSQTRSLPSTGNIGVRIFKPGTTTEFFIFENRGTGDIWAGSSRDRGILIWHVDESVSTGNQNQHMTPTLHYRVSVEQADGRFDLEFNRNRGDSTDAFDSSTGAFTDTTVPDAKWWNESNSGIVVNVLNPPGANMSVAFGSGGSVAGSIDLAASSDTGSSSTDNRTNDNTPTFNGTAIPSSTVVLSSSLSGTVGSATASGAGAWTMTASSMPQGTHVMSITSGGTLLPASLTIVIDTTAPAVPGTPDLASASDTGRSDTDNVTNDTTPTVSGSVSENGRVEILVNGVSTSTINTTGPWSDTLSLTGDGVHTIQVRAIDLAGNASNLSSALNITLDTTPPATPPGVPDLTAGTDSGASSSDNLTNIPMPTFTGSSLEASVQILSDGAVVGTGNVSSGTWSVTLSTALAEGTRAVAARAVDLAGNPGATSGALSVIVDITPPILSTPIDLAAGSDSGTLNTDNITNITTLSLSGTAPVGSVVRVYHQAVEVTSFVNPAAVWDHTTGTLVQGNHAFTFTAQDPAGNVSVPSPTLNVVIDTTSPAAPGGLRITAGTDTGISNSDSLTNHTQPAVQGTGDVGGRIQVFNGGVPVGAEFTNASGNWTFTSPTLGEGTYQFSASQKDAAGNQGPVSAAFQVVVDTTPPGPSSVPDLSPGSDTGDSQTDNLTRLTNLIFSGTAPAGTTVRLLVDGVENGSGTAPSGTWSITTGSLTDGVKQITARAMDAAGNLTTPTTALTVTVDTVASPPSVPDLAGESDTGFLDNDNITADVTPTFIGTGEAGTTIRVYVNGILCGSGGANPAWSIVTNPSPALTSGTHSATARTFDAAGNESSPTAPFSFTVSLSNPAQVVNLRYVPVGASPNTQPGVTNATTNNRTPRIAGLGTPDLRVHLYSGSTEVGVLDGTGGSYWSMYPSLADGTHLLTARNEDFAGNFSVVNALPVTLVVDATPPSPPANLRLRPDTDTGRSNGDNITSMTSPVIVAECEPAGTLHINLNGTVSNIPAPPNGLWEYPVTLSPGPHVLRIKQTDTATNVGEEAVLDFLIHNTPPDPPLAPVFVSGDDTGVSETDGITSVNTPRFTGPAPDGVTVFLKVDGTAAGPVISTGTWTIQSPLLADGPHVVTAHIEDEAGNASPASPPLNIVVDTVSPSVTVEQAANQTDPTIFEPVRFTATFSEPVHGFDPSGVSVTGPAGLGATVSLPGASSGDSVYTIAITDTDGEGLVIADVHPSVATDAAGNPNGFSSSVDNFVQKRRLPDPIEDVTASDDAHPDRIVITWTPSAEVDGYRIYRHAFNHPGAAVEVAVIADANASSWEDTSAPPGSWRWYWVRGEDEDGVGAFGTGDAGRAFNPDGGQTLTPIDEAEVSDAADIAWEDSAASPYDGLLRDTSDGRTLFGSLNLLVSRPKAGTATGGPATATLSLRGRKATLKGSFSQAGAWQAIFRQKDGSEIALNLRLQRTPGGQEVVRGTLSWAGVTARADLPRAPYHKAAPAPLSLTQKPYTLVLPTLAGWGATEPGGDGWATMRALPAGTVSVSGMLGDGTKFTDSAYLSEAAETFLYADLYRSVPMLGRIGGRLVFRDNPQVSDADGVFQWHKYADVREPRYATGFQVELWALASTFATPAKGSPSLAELLPQEYNARLLMSGTTLPAGLDQRVLTWLPADTFKHYGPESITGKAIRTTGAVTGTYQNPATRMKLPFSAVVFQKQALATGHFVLGAASGSARIQPGTAFTYPGSEDPGALTGVELPSSPAAPPTAHAATLEATAGGLYAGSGVATGQVTGALEAVRLTATGALSGYVWIGSSRYSLRGTLGQPVTITRPGLPDLTLNLSLTRMDGVANGFGLAGTLNADGVDHILTARQQPVFTKTNRSPHTGAHTVAMAAPGGANPAVEPAGNGAGTLSVSYLGACVGTFTLPDGTPATFGGFVSHRYDDSGTPTAEWTLHRALYGKVPRGYLSGTLVFRDTPGVSDLDGTWRWVKQANTAPLLVYPGGIDTTRSVVGSLYTPPAAGARAMPGLANDFHNLWLRLAGPDLSSLPLVTIEEIDRAATWTTVNKILHYGPQKVAVTFNAKTGHVSGSYIDAAQGVNVKFSGVLLQDQGLVTGSYLSLNRSGLFLAEPR